MPLAWQEDIAIPADEEAINSRSYKDAGVDVDAAAELERQDAGGQL